MNNQDWDDYCWERQGTAYGDMAKDHNDAILGRGKYAKPNQTYVANTGPRQPRRPSQPLAGEATLSNLSGKLDNAVHALIHIVSWKIWLVLGILCAVPTAIYASQQNVTTAGIVIIVGFNLALPWLLAHTVRLTLLAITIILGYCLIYTYLLVKVAIILALIGGGLYVLAKVMG